MLLGLVLRLLARFPDVGTGTLGLDRVMDVVGGFGARGHEDEGGLLYQLMHVDYALCMLHIAPSILSKFTHQAAKDGGTAQSPRGIARRSMAGRSSSSADDGRGGRSGGASKYRPGGAGE